MPETPGARHRAGQQAKPRSSLRRDVGVTMLANVYGLAAALGVTVLEGWHWPSSR